MTSLLLILALLPAVTLFFLICHTATLLNVEEASAPPCDSSGSGSECVGGVFHSEGETERRAAKRCEEEQETVVCRLAGEREEDNQM